MAVMTRDLIARRIASLGVKLVPHSKSARAGYNLAPAVFRIIGWDLESTFVTMHPYIYHPDGIDPLDFWKTLDHELVHWTRQADSWLPWWLIRYGTSQRFRWQEESTAYLRNIEIGTLTVDHVVAAFRTSYRITSVSEDEMFAFFDRNK